MIVNVERKNSETQMGFEPTTPRDLVGCSNHWATGDCMVSKGHLWDLTGTASRAYTAKWWQAHVKTL